MGRPRAGLMLLVLLTATACETSSPPAPVPPPATGAAFIWRELAPGLSERTEVAAAVSGTRIYVAGGYRGDGTTVATVEVFDTTTGAWASGPGLPVPVNHAMAASVAGDVYVFGGYDSGNRAFSGAFRLDGNSWRSVAQMPEGRAAGTAAVLDKKVYIAGGIAAGGGLAGQMLVYDTDSDTWATEAAPPTAREHLGGAGFGGRVYTVGGRTGAGNLAAFEVFDPGTKQWSSLPSMPTPRGGMSAAATCSGWIVAVGGEAQATFEEVEAFDVRAGVWRTLPDLPTPRHGLGVVTVGTVLYTLSGGPRPGLHVAASTEAMDLAGLGACP